jgi:glutamate synthase domain-containing protein 3
MSGGLAFVLDEAGAFRARVNPAMLDQLEPLDEADAIEVRDLVAEHERLTGSPVARRVLEDWDELEGSFVKVFPTDYKRVLAELEAQEAANAPRADEFAGEAADVVGEPHVRTGDGE